MSYEQIRTVEVTTMRQQPVRGKLFETEMTKKHVLIVDDESNGRKFWENLLYSMLPGVSIDWATSIPVAEKMIKGLKGNPYDLVISSFWLEGAESFYRRLHRKVRNFIFVSDLPISTRESKELIDRGLPVYLQKPFSLGRCRQLVSALCDLNISLNH